MTTYKGNRSTENGFEKLELNAQSGGRIVITNYKEEENVDVGSVHLMNKNGLGMSQWIRNRESITSHIKDIERISWLNDEEKKIVKEFLEEIGRG